MGSSSVKANSGMLPSSDDDPAGTTNATAVGRDRAAGAGPGAGSGAGPGVGSGAGRRPATTPAATRAAPARSAAAGRPRPSAMVVTTALTGISPANSPARSAPSRPSASYQRKNATVVRNTARYANPAAS